MKQFSLSIIIPCSDDIRIQNCIRSIDARVEVIISLNNASPEVRRIIKTFPEVRSVETKKKGIGLAYNNGIVAARHDWVLLMDSDCIFLKGTIEKMWLLTNQSRVIKGKVLFQSKNLLSKTISRLREFTTSDTLNAYSPPLLFHKNIVREIRYYFHPNLPWSEDADFDRRVKANGITIGSVSEATILHDSLSVREDLRSAFRYGLGRQIGKELGVYQAHTLISKLRNIIIVCTWTIRILRQKSVLTAVYYFCFWNLAFRLGTFIQRKFKYYKIYEV